MTQKKIGNAGYRPALELAWAQLKRSNLPDRVVDAGAKLAADGAILLRFFGRDYSIVADKEEIYDETGAEPHIGARILMLHYLNAASGLPAKNRETGFAQIPGATAYLAPFNGRVVYPLTGLFDRCGAGIADAFARVDGAKKDFATQCYEVRAFPRVTLTVIYWRGDEEVSSGGQVVFDEGITEYLPIEDIVITCEELVRRLRENLSQV